MIGAALTGYFWRVLYIRKKVVIQLCLYQRWCRSWFPYLKTKSKDYWEDEPEENPTLWDLLWKWLKGFSLKANRIPLEIVCYLLMFGSTWSFRICWCKGKTTNLAWWLVRMDYPRNCLGLLCQHGALIRCKFSITKRRQNNSTLNWEFQLGIFVGYAILKLQEAFFDFKMVIWLMRS